MLVLLSVAIAPTLALFSYFYLRNQLATEPGKTLLYAFLYGALLTFPILFLQYVLVKEQVFTNFIIQDVLFTGVIEEFFKWFLLALFIYHHIEFDDPYDGVLYGVTLSLGFATVENIIYIFSYGMHTAFLRAILPVSSHALFGVVMGYYLGKAKFSLKEKETTYKVMALFVPIALHVIYNAIFILGKNWAYVMIPFMIFLWAYSLHKVKRAHKHLEFLLVKRHKDTKIL